MRTRYRRVARWAVLALVAVVAAAGVWVRHVQQQRGPGPPIALEGELTLVGSAEGPDPFVRLSDLLRALDAAPVSGVPWAPPVPSVTASTPAPPAPPGKLRPLGDCDVGVDQCPWSAGGDAAARIWARPSSVGPCFVVVSVGLGRNVQRVERCLVPRMELLHSELSIYGDGRGVLVLISGYVQSQARGGECSLVYLLDRPRWRPQLVVDSRRLGTPSLAMLGESSKADRVYVGHLASNMARDYTHAAAKLDLWCIDTVTHSVALVCRAAPVPSHVWRLIPSPDGTFLATCPHPAASPRYRIPLVMVDSRNGAVHTLTSRGREGGYADSATAWSATVPGRLFFQDSDLNVWQLDTRLAAGGQDTTPARARSADE